MSIIPCAVLIGHLFYIQSCVSVNLKLLTDPFPTSVPAGNHKLAFYVCGCISVLYTSSLNLFSDRALCINSLNAHPSQEAGATATPISQMRKLRHQEVKYFAQSHTAAKQRSWDLNASRLDLDSPQCSQEMLGISNSVTNFKLCRTPHSNPGGNPHPSSTLTGHLFVIYSVPSVPQSLLPMVTSTLCPFYKQERPTSSIPFIPTIPHPGICPRQVQQVCKDTWPGMFR